MDDWLLRPPSTPDPPLPFDPSDAARVQHTRLRRRMLEGTWADDLKERIQRHMGPVRAAKIGPKDLSASIFAVLMRELATLHLEPPEVRHDDAEDLGQLTSALDAAGLWPMMPRYQMMLLGCREYLMRVSVDDAGGLVYRPVPPDMVSAVARPDRPGVPVTIAEARLREDPQTKRQVWTYDVLDISRPEAPSFRILMADRQGADLTAGFMADPASMLQLSTTGRVWPDEWRRADGSPVLPYVLHHAEWLSDRIWDPWRGAELVEGSLNHAVLLSWWLHLVKDACWQQKYGLNVRPAGLRTEGSDSETRQEIVTDPATMVLLETSSEDAAHVLVGSWSAATDPNEVLTGIEAYAARLAQDAGVAASDLHRMSGDPRSGYAISLTNDGKRASQRRCAASMRFGDSDLVGLSATMLNRVHGWSLPENGYGITYQAIPLSPEELRSKREHLLALIAQGLISRVEAYRELNPGTTAEQARRELAAIDAARMTTI